MLEKISRNKASFLPRRVRVYTATLGYPNQQPAVPPKKDVARKTRWIGFYYLTPCLLPAVAVLGSCEPKKPDPSRSSTACYGNPT